MEIVYLKDKTTFSQEKKDRCGCGTTDAEVLCTPETCDWYINASNCFNCFLVYKWYIQENTHTLQEVAKLLDISHTTVKQIETQALKKLRDLVKDGKITIDDLQKVLGSGD